MLRGPLTHPTRNNPRGIRRDTVEALRLSQDRVNRVSVGPLQIQRSQQPQFDHAATASAGAPTGRRRPSHAPITAGSLADASLVNVRLAEVPARVFPRPGRAGSPAELANRRARWRFTWQSLS